MARPTRRSAPPMRGRTTTKRPKPKSRRSRKPTAETPERWTPARPRGGTRALARSGTRTTSPRPAADQPTLAPGDQQGNERRLRRSHDPADPRTNGADPADIRSLDAEAASPAAVGEAPERSPARRRTLRRPRGPHPRRTPPLGGGDARSLRGGTGLARGTGLASGPGPTPPQGKPPLARSRTGTRSAAQDTPSGPTLARSAQDSPAAQDASARATLARSAQDVPPAQDAPATLARSAQDTPAGTHARALRAGLARPPQSPHPPAPTIARAAQDTPAQPTLARSVQDATPATQGAPAGSTPTLARPFPLPPPPPLFFFFFF